MNEHAVMFSTRQCSTGPETRTPMQRSVYESNILLQRAPLPFTRPSTSEIKVILSAILLVCRVLCRALVIFFCKAISMNLLFKTVVRSRVEERPPRVYILTLLCMMFLVNNGIYNAKEIKHKFVPRCKVWRYRGIVPLILNIVTSWSLVVSFTPRFYLRENISLYPLNWKVDGTKPSLNSLEQRIIACQLRFIGLTASSLYFGTQCCEPSRQGCTEGKAAGLVPNYALHFDWPLSAQELRIN